MRLHVTALLLSGILAGASPVSAADKVDWSFCQPEINKWCTGVHDKSGEEGVYQCLLKHDADLSKKCDNESHSKYEQLTGKAH